ncbi:MAG: DNA-processing protein DprA [Slackia sp.]|nr:DNA-processing protein DprA [Slackia sp.]
MTVVAGKARAIEGPRWEIARGAQGYPAAFECLDDPPSTLYIIGDPEALCEGLAVVGARKATPYGRQAARLFAGCAARRGIGIVSGGARGCDAAAHEAALEAKGRTVAFLGGGCDMPYPACNVGLFRRIVASGGAVASEHAWEVPPKPYAFRARNRLIAGLARATLVVEAGVGSGTFSTADAALRANREVLAVPGSVFSATSRGSNMLIGQGAMPVVDEGSFCEMLDRLFPDSVVARSSCVQSGGAASISGQIALPLLSERESNVAAALAADPMRLEQMVAAFAQGPDAVFAGTSELMACIGRLEALGAIERFPDGRFGAVR